MDNLLTVTSSPHIKIAVKTKNIMGDVIVALMPLLVWSIYVFGFRALTITIISVISCVFFEYIYRKFTNKSNTISDLSAIVTGILLAYSLPVSVPLWLPIIGALFAIIVFKQLFGGIGRNSLNPVLAARLLLSIVFPKQLTYYTLPGKHLSPLKFNISKISADILASATPLSTLKGGIMPETEISSSLIGYIPGTIGEVSATLIILTGIYLLLRKVITWHIPVIYLGTVAIISFIFPIGNLPNLHFMFLQLFSGSLMLGAFFMATDYATSPVTPRGQMLYGAGCGLITIFIRYFTDCPEGVCFAILIMNLLVFRIDIITAPGIFGTEKHKQSDIKSLNFKDKFHSNILKKHFNKIDEIPFTPHEGYRAQVMCSGTHELAKKKFLYQGINDCVSANKISGGDKLCPYGCIGLGTCAAACKHDAIHIINGVAAVDYEKCVACGNCVSKCPKNIIKLIPYNAKHWVGCTSKNAKEITENYCEVGCIGCKTCENSCPNGAIRVTDNIASIDYTLCSGCGICENKCPRKIIWSARSQSEEGVIIFKQDLTSTENN